MFIFEIKLCESFLKMMLLFLGRVLMDYDNISVVICKILYWKLCMYVFVDKEMVYLFISKFFLNKIVLLCFLVSVLIFKLGNIELKFIYMYIFLLKYI